MAGMRREAAWRTLLRSRWLVLSFVVLATGTTAVVSKLQAPVYLATATLVVNQPSGEGVSFDLVQANQAYARTLARLIGSENVAAEVLDDVPTAAPDADALLQQMSFAPVTETQLIEVQAESRDAQAAARTANAYAETFVGYVSRNIPNAAPSSGVSVADEAVVPSSPDRPKPTLYTLLALVLSSALAVALVLIRSRVDTRVHDNDTLQAELGIPVLGVLPRIGRSQASQRLFEEAVRLLGTSVAHAGRGPVRSIVVTSSLQGEGKSTVVAELSTALGAISLTDNAVLAVDADMRRPALHKRLGLPDDVGEHRGLTTFLREQHDIEAVVVATELSSLRMIPAGPLPSHPSALLGFPASRAALRALVDHADVVVLDTPPVTVGADASLVAMDADCVLMVVDLSRARLPDLRSAVDQLSKVGRRPLGLIVNRADLKDRASAYAAYTKESDRSRRRLSRRRSAVGQVPEGGDGVLVPGAADR
jgi:capsular exopolysaccharide synthesis family protein